MNNAVTFASAFIRLGTVFLPVRTDIAPASAGGAVALYDGSVFAALADFILADRGVPEPCLTEACVCIEAPGGFDQDPESGFPVISDDR